MGPPSVELLGNASHTLEEGGHEDKSTHLFLHLQGGEILYKNKGFHPM